MGDRKVLEPLLGSPCCCQRHGRYFGGRAEKVDEAEINGELAFRRLTTMFWGCARTQIRSVCQQ